MEKVHNYIPTGPVAILKRKDGVGNVKEWTYFEGKNEFSLRAPDDEKAWVGVYHYIEKITKEMYYFGFQMTGDDGDKEIVNRFINQSSNERFSFGQTYSKAEDNLVPTPTEGLSVRGGSVLVTGGGSTDVTVSPSPVIIASSQRLEAGMHRVICRLFSPGTGRDSARGNNRDAQSFKFGSIGILRTNQMGDGPTNSWAQRQDIMEPWMKEETVFAVQYDADERQLTIHGCSNISWSSRFHSDRYTLSADTPGDLHIAIELTPKSLNVTQTILSVRSCEEQEWTKFIAHTAEHNSGGNANGADMFDPVQAMQVINNRENEMGGPQPMRIRHQIFRQAVRNRRRERAAAEGNAGGNAGVVVQVRMDGGRRIARLLPQAPVAHRPIAQQQQQQGAVAEAAAAAAPPAQGQVVRRRIIRAIRPVAARMMNEMEVDEEGNDSDDSEATQPLRWNPDEE